MFSSMKLSISIIFVKKAPFPEPEVRVINEIMLIKINN